MSADGGADRDLSAGSDGTDAPGSRWLPRSPAPQVVGGASAPPDRAPGPVPADAASRWLPPSRRSATPGPGGPPPAPSEVPGPAVPADRPPEDVAAPTVDRTSPATGASAPPDGSASVSRDGSASAPPDESASAAWLPAPPTTPPAVAVERPGPPAARPAARPSEHPAPLAADSADMVTRAADAATRAADAATRTWPVAAPADAPPAPGARASEATEPLAPAPDREPPGSNPWVAEGLDARRPGADR